MENKIRIASVFILLCFAALMVFAGQDAPVRKRTEPAPIESSWNDIFEGVKNAGDWKAHKEVLRQRYLDLIRDSYKPSKPPLDLITHESVRVDGRYERRLISYAVEAGERAHAFLAIPLGLRKPVPAIVSLHGTYAHGKEREAGLEDNPEKAFLDQLARRGYVVIAPDHFVAGERIPPEGAYITKRFYEKHPEWTAVGKSVYEHAIAVDVLCSLPEVDAGQIGVIGHSLGGHGAYFLSAYDPRVKVTVANSACAPFRQNNKVEAWGRDQWYVYFKHIRPGLLRGELPPIDMHEIMALVAPRPFLDLSALNDYIAGDEPRLAQLTYRQRVLMLMKVMDVYEIEQAPRNFSFYSHGQGHNVTYEARQLIYGWFDKHLRGGESEKAELVRDSGFYDLGIAAPVTESRGVVVTRDAKGRFLTVSSLLDMSPLGSLLVTDIDTGETKQYEFPEMTRSERFAEWAPYASLLSGNGRFYTFAGKTLLEFDVDERRFTFAGVPAPGESCYTGACMIDGPDGRIYAGSYPNSHLVSFDPKTREMKDHGQLDTRESYPSNMAVDSAGWVYCGIGTARFNIVAFDPKTEEMRQMVDEKDRALGTARVFAGEDGNAYGQAGETWYKMLAGRSEAIAKEQVPALRPWRAIGFGQASGVFPDGRELVRYNLPERWMLIKDPKTGAEKTTGIRFRSGGASVSTVGLGPDGKIYGSTSHPMHMFAYDPAARALADFGAVKKIGGGNICAMASQGKYLVGPSYSLGYFHRFDTTRPFDQRGEAGPNPDIIAQFEGDITRPRTCLAHPDGKHVLMAGFMGYGMTGGGIGIVNLETGEKNLLKHDRVIPFHSTHSLKALPNGDLVGGTSVLTPGGGHAKDKEGVLYIMDWKTKKVVFRTVPVPGAEEVFSLEVGPDGLVYGIASESKFFVFDPKRRMVTRGEDLSRYGGLVRPALISGPGESVYAVLSASILRIRGANAEVEKIAESPVPITAGLALKDGWLYFASSSRLWRYRLPGA